ncbi:E3 ubiquitin-protein ligase tom1 [Exophiala dermatitidis]|uniref:HECT-type E3 ubiquitin transferase n=2 Tax=Exophiala dermatitidis TaxID=5970 RepID=H6C4S4_EXODN|nr:E3 ubiquitin-protein ligase HUWE1 [Exophiala dermatitidis NIH/UT8656]KAJ4513044.1 E3 ubiquitin-protein ligase tom1 [Exophiala dermatitidis]EHY57695.1 E3 ubiquitin-protein ligase HUWE1 [Exophiala dermatitidis NIH/UT8656]KAJ4516093.1 E3 ubiquitin-protein ligase tom1 [Exophiala dermatitidis]KAJ4518502.1 E3 ubiquitin-protein ligase tom1 [Exophiala dermatitidis]KAJ4534000.1 E3 ubiquitin-protein ligase tom1 [Exophiala dermatitidis]
MGKVTRKPQEKHKVSLSPAVSDLVKKISTAPLAELPALFSGWSQRWPYPRGDLNNWIEPLDRFDSILADFNAKYGLDKGPQTVPFGISLLLEGSPGVDEKRLQELGFGPEGDRELVEAILVFSKLLVEKCANRAVYNSTDRLNDLLNTASLSLLHSTLRITFYLAQRYAERTPPSRQHVTKFYDFDHERLQRLAAPFGQPNSLLAKRGATSPIKTLKSKEKGSLGSKPRRGSSAVNPNDFRSLCKDTSSHGDRGKSTAAPDREWLAWAHVKVSWSATEAGQKPTTSDASQATEPPGTPTPVRQATSGLGRVDTTGSPSGSGSRVAQETDGTEVKSVEYGPGDLTHTTIEAILQSQPDDMPPKARYELLHQLRVAYGLITSVKTRKELLAVRLLAISSLANVFNEPELSQKLFPTELGGPKPHDLVQQIVSLIHDTKKVQSSVSLYLQTLAMDTIGVLARLKTFAPDINAALGAGSSQGLLSQLIQKGLTDVAKDNDSTDTPVGDDWREAVFSMPATLIEATGHHGRSSEAVITPSFLTTYLSGFNITTGKALRVHLRMLDFIKTFFHHFKDGLATLTASNAFESISNLLGELVTSAWTLLQAGEGIPAQYKTRATDYEIPYVHQQIIRSIIDMINDISGHQGAQADRVLRSLVDSQALLRAFRLIVDHLSAFGAHTWSELVKAVGGFLHNEPTSYTVIAEAGIVQSLLNTVTVSQSQPSPQNPRTISSEPEHLPQGIPPVVDAIIQVAQIFSAICLTNAGFELFKSSGALEKYFEMFESPAHVKVLNDANILAHLGSTFDEFVRHHPNLRDSVLSAVIVMIARVRHISRMLAVDVGAGPKLWLGSSDGHVPCGGREALSLEMVPSPSTASDEPLSPRTIGLPNGNTLTLVTEVLPPSTVSGIPRDEDSYGLKAHNYARPAVAFLVAFFENQSLCTSFLECGGCDLVLDYITLPSLPVYDGPFERPDGMLSELSAAVHMMAETKPHLVLPALADRAHFACSELKHFSQSQSTGWSSYFAPLVKAAPESDTSGQPSGAPLSEVELNGTRIAKALMAVFCLAQVLAEVFNAPMYSTRSSQNYLFGLVNLADVFADMCKLMGGICAASYHEDIAIQRLMPDSWIPATRPELFTTGDDEVDKILSVQDSSSRAGQNTEEPSTGTNSDSSNSELDKQKETPFFENARVLRYLLIETPAAITEFLCRLGRGLAGRRRPDTFARQKATAVADALASAYLTQLQPYFLTSGDRDEGCEPRFRYLVIALDNVRCSFYDDSHPSSGPMASPARQSFVVEAFRKAGGVKVLTKIGTEFFDKLKGCKVEHSTFSANTGLKICLDILDQFTDSKSIMESLQSNIMRNNDPSKPFYFNPAQTLLSLRMEALPLTRLIWESEYADQASKDVVQKLVSIFKHIFTGDHESEAVQNAERQPVLTALSPRRMVVDPQKVAVLKSAGYDEGLAREAVYRTNSLPSSNSAAAAEYCKAITANPRRRRLPIPEREDDITFEPQGTPGMTSPSATSNSLRNALLEMPASDAFAAVLAGVVNNALDDSLMEDVDSAHQQTRPSTTAPDDNAGNGPEGHSRSEQPPADSPTFYSVESINAERAVIREDLADRCNNILNNHPNLTFELSDLIVSATKKLPEDAAKDYWRTTSDLLVSSLLSMQVEDDINEARGKKIAAAAHLVALLIQDGEVFKETLNIYQEAFDGLLSFLRLPTSDGRSAQESFPWVAPVLIIVEKMLSKDAEPAEVKWYPPTDLDTVSKAEVIPSSVLDLSAKRELFDALVDLLPRVGKDKLMGLAITRVLVILTRERALSSRLAEKRNLQRLFLMIKQLANDVGHRLQSAFMIVLRHIVEDDDILRQIMRSEIRAFFTLRNSSRHIDIGTYLREMHHLVIRSPDTFVSVTNELVKISAWQPHYNNTVSLILKDAGDGKEGEGQPAADPGEASMQPAASVEPPDDSIAEPGKSKTSDIKPPIVEHPDGVIHFILSELLNYKDVEDKDTPAEPQVAPGGREARDQQQVGNAQATQDEAVDSPQERHNVEKANKFKPDDHPIFAYRCFLMYSLTELLHSYNRTKVELINFSRKADPMAVTPSKPRAGVLNYLLNGLIPSGYVDKEESAQFKKKVLTSDWAIRVIVALCSKTGEMGMGGSASRLSMQPQVDDTDDEPDLTFVRRFVLEHAIKSYKDAILSNEPLQMKYSRLLCLADLFNRLLTKPAVPEGSAGSQNTSYKVLARMMFEKNLTQVLTSSLADIDLSYPGSKRVIKFILRPLQELTSLATHLSLTSPDFLNNVAGNMSEDVISSASSVSDVEDEREETPDLFRNSALGILDRNRDSDSSSGSDEGDEDEEMYDEEYEDEMEYDDGVVAAGADDEPVSDEEIDDEMAAEGEIEGLPGDVPMDIEFVMNDHMDVETDDESEDDEDESEEDDDEDDEDESGEDYMAEDDEEAGEINGDDENHSLNGGPEDEVDWEDEDDDQEVEGSDEQDDIDDIDYHGEPMPTGVPSAGVLSNLLRALGNDDLDGPGGLHHVPPELIVPAAGSGDRDDEDDEEDEEDEGDEMDENGGMDYDDFGFDHYLTGGDNADFDDQDEALLWNEIPVIRRPRHFRAHGGGHSPAFLGRRVGHRDDLNPLPRAGRISQHGRSAGDDGLNPLLRRPEQANEQRPIRLAEIGPGIFMPPGFDDLTAMGGFPPLGGTFHTVIRTGDGFEAGGHGAMLDAILQALHRRDRTGEGTRLQFSMTAPLSEIREVLRPSMSGIGHRHHGRDESSRSGNFIPALTMTRWQEEARLLFSGTHVEKANRVQYLIMASLVPLAQQEEKERRRKREEEHQREEMERQRLEEEKRKKEAEEREAAAKAEEERLRAESEAAAAAERDRIEQSAEHDDGDTEPMEDVRGTEADNTTQGNQESLSSGEDASGSQSRIFTTIRGRQIDITGLSIDQEYLEALPEELREEVIMQQYATRREQARNEGTQTTSGIDPDFLDALPEDIREEIRQQEAHAQRRREREAARRQAAATTGTRPRAEEMDGDSILASFEPSLRREVLAEQTEEILNNLDPRHAAEGRAHARHLFRYTPMAGRDTNDQRAKEETAQRENKRQIIQMVDKSGVATLLRLMFIPQQGSLRTNLWHILRNICGNRQTRFEVINLLLVILKEGSTDVTAVERSLANLSLRAKATVGQKTPQPLKRTLSMQAAGGISEEVTPLVVVQQCLSALKQLCQSSFHTRTLFLREAEVGTASRKGKGKAKDNKAVKYPINDLISLLDRKLIVESTSCLQALAELLSAVTQPLPLLLRKDKDKASDDGKATPGDNETQAEGPSTSARSAEAMQLEAGNSNVEAGQGSTAGSTGITANTTSEEQPQHPGAHESAEKDPSDASNDDLNPDDAKSRKTFEPPEISERNLHLVVSIFVAPECSSDTFHSTLETLSSLSCIPGTAAIFSKELINHVNNLSQAISAELDELLPHLREAQSITDLHAIASSKFSHAGSDQVKLLRVLRALDYLSAPKPDSDENDERLVVKNALTSSYASLRPVWTKLSECLTVIREKDNITSFATILLPLIESLMVVCKNTPLKDPATLRQGKEQGPGSPAAEPVDDLQELFFNFTTEHRKILNDIIRQSPKLMQGNGSFSLLVKNPKVLDFDNKRAYFTKQIHSRLHQQRHIQPPLTLNVRRDQVFLDSYKALYYKTADEMKYGKLNIRFNGEEGVDAGGVTREWFQVLARGMFNPDWALWQPVAADRTTFHPNPLSWINGEHLLYFKFIGRIIGKALHEGRVLDCHFSRAVYKRLLGKEPNLKDLESMDLDYYKSLVWILENDITDVITEDFSVIEEQFGEEKVVDLIPNGRNIPVTEENKREYVHAQVRYRLTTSVKDQLEAFVKGFHDIIPAELIAIFDEQELELLISGLPEIDVDDWRAHTEYHNYTANSPQVTWFWRVVRNMSNEERAKLLQFVTGTSKVPLNGFKDLEGMQGNTLFSIHKDPSSDRLPTSHTCFNQLDLPTYDDYETLKSNLMKAINLGADYFGFA